MHTSSEELFINICSTDHMDFIFKGVSYERQLDAARRATGSLCAMHVYHVKDPVEYVRAVQEFAFMGGSLGCAEGEKLSRACEYCVENDIPLVIEAASGGVRMQEGVVALMQMSNTTSCIESVKQAGIPVIVVIKDPCYGGTSGSFATLGDLTFGIKGSRFGFAGQNVIKNTIFNGSDEAFDRSVPAGFQTTDRAAATGAIDQLFDSLEDAYAGIHGILKVLSRRREVDSIGAAAKSALLKLTGVPHGAEVDTEDAFLTQDAFVYRDARSITRPQPCDYLRNFVNVAASLRIDKCINVMFGAFADILPVIAIATSREDVTDPEAGLGSPIGYRFAARAIHLANRLSIPIITLVDTAGALPSPEAEEQCQSRAISECLLAFQAVHVPIISVITGEGGSGGALALAGGNYVGILSKAFYNVISPEGAASILQPSIYRNNIAEMKANFISDAEILAHVQKCYPVDLKNAGVVNDIIIGPEYSETRHTCKSTSERISIFIAKMLIKCSQIKNLRKHRNIRYRKLSVFTEVTMEKAQQWVAELKGQKLLHSKAKRTLELTGEQQEHLERLKKVALYLTDAAHLKGSKLFDVLNKGKTSPPLIKEPYNVTMPETITSRLNFQVPESPITCKSILKSQGPEAVCKYIIDSGRLFYTDTTFRDAHQSLLATRLRTRELIEGAILLQSTSIPSMQETPLFSVECWGGATFDTSLRFLDEDPYERLKLFNEAMPHTLTQMLFRGANAVGYTAYESSFIEQFIIKTAAAGLDVFRVFDAFNNLQQMEVAVDTILSKCQRSICEICICFTGDFLNTTKVESIYTLDYYSQLCKEIATRWPRFHILCIKDMAGLLRPAHAVPLIAKIREAIGPIKPIHFHTHDTSGAGMSTCLAMAKAGCHIVDLASSSLAGSTSQPSLQTFLQIHCTEESIHQAKNEQADTVPRFFRFGNCCGDVAEALSVYDSHWRLLRKEYRELDTNFSAPSADVYKHEMPGGQISNLYQQCCEMGLEHRWSDAMDIYARCNAELGSLIKVTPSSKVVGDLALFLLAKNLEPEILRDRQKSQTIDWPDSLISLLKGKLGLPHHGFPLHVIQHVLKLSEDDARAHLQFLEHSYRSTSKIADPQQTPKDMQYNEVVVENSSFNAADAEMLCSTMYPKPYAQFLERIEKYSSLLWFMPASVYCKGLTVGESCWLLFETGIIGSVTLSRVQNTDLQRTERKFEFTLELFNGDCSSVKPSIMSRITFKTPSKATLKQIASIKHTCIHKYVTPNQRNCPMADLNNETHVAASIPGVVEKLLVMVGQEVKEGDELLRIGSAKLDLVLTAHRSGRVNEITCHQNMSVMPGSLLLVVS